MEKRVRRRGGERKRAFMEERRNSSPLRCCLIHYGWLFFHRPVTTGERKELQKKEPFSPLFSLGLEGRQSEDRQSLKFFPRGRLHFLLPLLLSHSRERVGFPVSKEEKKTAIFIARNRSEDFSLPRPFISRKAKGQRSAAAAAVVVVWRNGASYYGRTHPAIYRSPLSLPSLLGNEDPAAHLSCRLSSDSLGLFVTPALSPTWLSLLLLLFLIVFLCLVSPAVPEGGRRGAKAHSWPSLPTFPPK